MTECCLGIIRFYQRWISPLSRPHCRFHPTCSAYAHEALRRYGVFYGVGLAAWRLQKCHPFHSGGIDPVH